MENAQAKIPHRQRFMGVVTSAAGDKTIRVTTSTLVKHAQYGKYIRHHSKIAAHDEKNVAKKGDTVEIVSCRRISKSKAFRLLRVVKTATLPEGLITGAEQISGEQRTQQ